MRPVIIRQVLRALADREQGLADLTALEIDFDAGQALQLTCSVRLREILIDFQQQLSGGVIYRPRLETVAGQFS